MKKITDEIVLRPLEETEKDFWRKVFYDSVRSHFESLQMADEQLNLLLNMQFEAQEKDYGANYPESEKDIILFNNQRAGRMIVSTEENDLHLIDIAILTEFRNRGIGTKILEYLFEESRKTKLPIRFYVEKINPAFRLYERLGFRTKDELPTHFRMEWIASE